MVRLIKAKIEDAKLIHEIQVESFMPLLKKYNDVDTNPANEKIESIIKRLEEEKTDYYLVYNEEDVIGTVRVVKLGEETYKISPMCILPKYQGNGYAQKTIKAVEELYNSAKFWYLNTIKEESKLCHLYEKMGYKITGDESKINDKMTIIEFFKKVEK